MMAANTHLLQRQAALHKHAEQRVHRMKQLTDPGTMNGLLTARLYAFSILVHSFAISSRNLGFAGLDTDETRTINFVRFAIAYLHNNTVCWFRKVEFGEYARCSIHHPAPEFASPINSLQR